MIPTNIVTIFEFRLLTSDEAPWCTVIAITHLEAINKVFAIFKGAKNLPDLVSLPCRAYQVVRPTQIGEDEERA